MIRVADIRLTFGQRTIFDSFSLHVEKGERVVLTGESGGGKTSLLNLLAGFVVPDAGTVCIGGEFLSPQSVHAIRQTVAYLPQDVNLDLSNGRELLLYPFSFRYNRDLLPSSTEIACLLDRLLLDQEVLTQPLAQLSGGQKQRLLFGAVYLLKRPLLLLDEPTAALDDLSVRALCALLDERPETTLLSVSHDQRWIESADRIVVLTRKDA